MKLKELNISFTRSGSGSESTRISLPVKWLRDKLKITKEDKKVYVYQFSDSILIKKTPLKWDRKQVLEYNLADITSILENKSYITYDEVGVIAIDTLNAYCNGDKEKEKKYWGATIGAIQDWLEKNCVIIFENENDKSFFCKKDLGIKTLEEFQTFLQSGGKMLDTLDEENE